VSSASIRLGAASLASFVLLGSASAIASADEPAAAPGSSVDALREEVRALRAEVESARKPAPAEEKPPEAPPPRPLGYEGFWPWAVPAEGIHLGGYLQSQFETHQDSQDQLNQGGAVLNRDRVSIRRARVNLTGEWQYAAIALELDANTTNGPQVDLRKAEASLQYRPDRSKPAVLMATVGQFDTPFGYELVESPRTRWFLERSSLSRAFWPGEPDLGFRFAGALGFFRWTIATINGEPLGESTPYSLQDPNAAKDVVVRLGVDVPAREDVQIAGGISAIRGKGFHAGTDATKSSVTWSDINGDGVIEPIELQPIIGRAATPSQSFDRWAVGADLRLNIHSWLGTTKIYGEFVVAENMDRALYPADPVSTGLDQRELGFYAGILQEITPYGVIGFRYDYYDPNSDVLDNRRGRLLPFSAAVTTYAPLIGVAIPDRARLLVEYDIIKDAFARDPTGVPADLKNNTWTLRLQVQL
jgi:Phosphate-selective porin O and P